MPWGECQGLGGIYQSLVEFYGVLCGFSDSGVGEIGG